MTSSNQQQIFALIKAISGQANILTIPVVFVKMLKGNHRAALLLSQSIYWSDRSHQADGWFDKSFREWLEEIGLNQHAIETAVAHLKKFEVLETKLGRVGQRDTTFYRPQLEKIAEMVQATLAESAKVTLADSAKVHKRKTITSTIEHRSQTEIKQQAAAAADVPVKPVEPVEPVEPQRDLVWEALFQLVYGQPYQPKVSKIGKGDSGKLGKLKREVLEVELTADQIPLVWKWWQRFDWRVQAVKARNLQAGKQRRALEPIPRPKITQVSEILSAAALWIKAGAPEGGISEETPNAGRSPAPGASGTDARITTAVQVIQRRAAERAAKELPVL